MSSIISILVPVYKVERYITRCLTSILTQTMQDGVELIIVNDCTPDDSINIAKQVIADTPSKITTRIIQHSTNKGVSITREAALEAANGEYITIIDSDDYVAPNLIERLYEIAIQNDKKDDIIVANYCKRYPNGQCEYYNRSHSSFSFNDVIIDANGETYLVSQLIKRDLFTKNNIHWDPKLNYCEDHVLSIQLFHAARCVTYIPDCLYYYCIEGYSITRKKKYSLTDINNHIYAANFVQEFINNNRIPNCHIALSMSLISFKYSIITQAMTFKCDRYELINLWPEAKDALPAFFQQNKSQFGLLAKPLFYAIVHCNYPLFYIVFNLIKLKKSIIG